LSVIDLDYFPVEMKGAESSCLLLREKIGNAITATRLTDYPFASEYDLERRVPSIHKTELTLLAKLEHSTGQERSMIAARLPGARNALGKRIYIKM
jgi:hypothetical protein